jgi:hypothetical protein
MSLFPHPTAVAGTAKKYDPNGDTYTNADKDGYILYGHDITADNSTTPTVNYVVTEITKGTYYVDSSGTVTQQTTGYE